MAYPVIDAMRNFARTNPGKTALLVFELLVFLGALGFGIYCYALTISLILSALAATSMPYGLAVFIAILPLLVGVAIMAKLLQFLMSKGLLLLQMMTLMMEEAALEQKKANNNSLLESEEQRLSRITAWFAGMPKRIIAAIMENPARIFFAISSVFSFPTAIGFGIYLAVQVLPGVVAAIAAKGVAYGLAVYIGGVMAGCGLIYLTFAVLAMPSIAILCIQSVWSDVKKLLGNSKLGQPGDIRALAPLITKLAAVAFAAYLSSIVYPLTLEALVVFAPHGLAVFTALAICVGMTLFIPILANAIASYVVGRNKESAVAEGKDTFGVSVKLESTGLVTDSSEPEVPVQAEAFSSDLYDRELHVLYADIISQQPGSLLHLISGEQGQSEGSSVAMIQQR